MATNLLQTNFADGQGDWTIVDKSLPSGLDYVWKYDGTYGMMKASAYKDAAAAAESWLVSPAIDLSGTTTVTLAINHAMNKGSKAVLAVKATKDDGTTWTDVTLSPWPAGKDWTFIDAEADLSAFAGEASVKIAFAYASTASDCPTWEIKTVIVADGGVVPIPLDTISVAKAIEIAEALTDPESGKSTYDKKECVVRGYAVSVYTQNTDGSWSFWMADEIDAYGGFMASNTTTDSEVSQGDNMYVRGTIAKYKAKSSGNIQLQIYKGTGEHGEEPSAINNVNAQSVKAMKVVENGQLFIIRNGVKYNAAGAIVK